MSSRKFRVLTAVLLAIPIALVMYQLTGTPDSTNARLGTLPGRGLEPPWWQAVSFVQTPTQETYAVPSDVLFATASSEITSQGESILLGMVPELKKASSLTVAGCTDSVGGVDSPYNVDLSQQRANAAVAILETAGLSSSIFQTMAWADTHPAVTAPGLDTATVNALNRRVVITVTLSTPSSSS